MVSDETPYVSVALDEYVDLINLKEFFYVLKDYNIEEWEFWNQAVYDFLEEENLPDLPF